MAVIKETKLYIIKKTVLETLADYDEHCKYYGGDADDDDGVDRPGVRGRRFPSNRLRTTAFQKILPQLSKRWSNGVRTLSPF